MLVQMKLKVMSYTRLLESDGDALHLQRAGRYPQVASECLRCGWMWRN